MIDHLLNIMSIEKEDSEDSVVPSPNKCSIVRDKLSKGVYWIQNGDDLYKYEHKGSLRCSAKPITETIVKVEPRDKRRMESNGIWKFDNDGTSSDSDDDRYTIGKITINNHKGEDKDIITYIVKALRDKNKCDLYSGVSFTETRKELMQDVSEECPIMYIRNNNSENIEVASFIKYRVENKIKEKEHYFIKGDAEDADPREINKNEYIELLKAALPVRSATLNNNNIGHLELVCSSKLQKLKAGKPVARLLRELVSYANDREQTAIYLTQSSHNKGTTEENTKLNEQIRKKYSAYGFHEIQIDGETITDIQTGDDKYEWPLIAYVKDIKNNVDNMLKKGK